MSAIHNVSNFSIRAQFAWFTVAMSGQAGGERTSQQRSRVERLAGRRELAPDEAGDLIDRIDAERAGRALVTRLTTLPATDRAVVELVDLAGLQPKEAAQVLGIAPGTLRMRRLAAGEGGGGRGQQSQRQVRRRGIDVAGVATGRGGAAGKRHAQAPRGTGSTGRRACGYARAPDFQWSARRPRTGPRVLPG